MKKILKAVLLILLFSVVCYSQTLTEVIQNYRLLNVGYISIPSNMEIQSGNYKKLLDSIQTGQSKPFSYEVSSNKVIFQQRGLNDLDKSSFGSYARVILETTINNIGDYEKITTKYTATQTELAELSKNLKLQVQQGFSGTQLKLISWYGVSIVTINGRTALKISYLRQLGDNPYVVVNNYRFQNNDRLHSLTLSYRQSDESNWKPLFTNILNSFTITNVR